MPVLNIVSRVIKYIFIVTGSLFPSCKHPAPPPAVTQNETITPPEVPPGNTERHVVIEVSMSQASSPAFAFTDLAFDKDKGLLLMKDDGIVTDYTIVYKILNGGVVNGKSYPGFTYDDGTGKKIGYKYSFAVNTNDEHASSPNLTTWAQMTEMISKGHSIMNHTMFHGGADKLKALKDAEKNLWTHTHYRMTEIVPPGNEEGFVETGLQLGYKMVSSEFGEPVPDGNNSPGNENMSWGSYIPMTTQNFKKVLASRTNLGDQWNAKELAGAKAFVDYIFNNPNRSKKPVGTAFSHGPFGDQSESAVVFNEFMTYIKDHPSNNNSAWITSSKELMDYVATKAQVITSSASYSPGTKKYKIVLDMDRIDPNVIYRNLSLKISGGKIANVTASGVDEVTFNQETGLINIYKTDRSKVIDPFSDILPPQITSITAKENVISILYDKPVDQQNMNGYEVTGNQVVSLRGSGKKWELVMKDPVSAAQKFYYRMQRGDAAQQGSPALRVCTYTGMAIQL